MPVTLYTIGHSTRELDEFLALLHEHRIARIVDVRRFPGSRRYPHFGSESLRNSLAQAGIAYRHAVELGGRRRPAADSPNTYWRNDAFRAYADYMMTPEFRRALSILLREAEAETTAIMCAEAVPWRCHRNLISDSAVGAGASVRHIVGLDAANEHRLSEGAQLHPEGYIWYPRAQEEQGSLGL